MRKRIPHLLCFFMLCASFSIGAQDVQITRQWRNAISANVLSLKSNYYETYGSLLYLSVMSGISYSRHLGPHAFRAGLEYRDYLYTTESDGAGRQKYREGKCNLGYQLAFSDKAVSPYLALDFIYLFGKVDSEFQGGYAGKYSKLDLIRQGIGFAPAFGIQFQLFKSISIGMETNVEFLWIQEKGTILRGDSYSSTNKITFQVDRDNDVWHWNPINAIALNFGF